jgi:hypothetical protein
METKGSPPAAWKRSRLAVSVFRYRRSKPMMATNRSSM